MLAEAASVGGLALRAVRRTAAGAAGDAVRISGEDEGAGSDDEGNNDSDDEPGQKQAPMVLPGMAWMSCRRRLRRFDVPAVAVAAGALVWLICFVIVDDPFASFQGDAKASSVLPDGPAILEESWSVPLFGRSAANNSLAVTMNVSQVNLENSSFEGGADRVKAWLGLTSSRARARANASATLLRSTATRFKEKTQEGLRRKEEQLIEKGEQVHNASLALAGAIESGEVQSWVVVYVVVAFFTGAAILQFLSSARGTFREVIRAMVSRTLPSTLAPNELVTRPYASWGELAVRVSLDFLNEPANLMLVSIGSLQVLATWSKADPWRCKKINLLVLLLNFAYTLVQEARAQWLAAKHDATWNLSTSSRVVGGRSELVLAKDICVGDLIVMRHGDLCAASGQIVDTSHSFVLFNSLCETGEDCCSILRFGDRVLKGFVLASEGAEVQIQVTETRNSNQQPVEVIESDGAKASRQSARPVTVKSRRMERFPEHMNGPLMQANLASLALLFVASALCCALSYGLSSPAASQEVDRGDWTRHANEKHPLSQAEWLLVTHFFSAAVQLNTVIPSMRWVVLFFLFVFLVEAARPDVSIQNWRAFQGIEHRRIMYSDKTGTLTEVRMHVARLRLVEGGADLAAAPPSSQIAAGQRPLSLGPKEAASAAAASGQPGAGEGLAWLAAVLMACNDCQARPKGLAVDDAGATKSGASYLGLRPGTSPEEIAVAEHIEAKLGLGIECNPLQPGLNSKATPSSPSRQPKVLRRSSSENFPIAAEELSIATNEWPLVLRDLASGQEVARVKVLERSNFEPARGCREATICMADRPDDCWLVRQGGSDVIAEWSGKSAREAQLAAEDKDRALGWCVARVGADGSRAGAWQYILRASFSNPPRPSSAALVSHCWSSGVAVRVLTGDASVAALHISREIGVFGRTSSASSSSSACPMAILCYEPGESASKFGSRILLRQAGLGPQEVFCVAIPGSVVKAQVEAADGTDAWLADERTSAVIYRTRAADKALIVRRTEELGREKRHQVAAARSLGLRGQRALRARCRPSSSSEEGFCWMMGDAANDAEAIGLEDIVGVSLRHGAAPCRLGADFIVDDPGGVIAIQTELRGRALAGARWLLGDTCQLCGMISSMTLCGIWTASFRFLPRGFLYDDPFDARIMTVFSGMLYPFSACAAACCVGGGLPSPSPTLNCRGDVGHEGANFRSPKASEPAAAMGPVRSLLQGVAIGTVLGLIGPMDDPPRFGRWMLAVLSTLSFFRHAIAPFTCPGWSSICFMGLSCLPKAAAAAAEAASAVLSTSSGQAWSGMSAPNFVSQFLRKVGTVQTRVMVCLAYLIISCLIF